MHAYTSRTAEVSVVGAGNLGRATAVRGGWVGLFHEYCAQRSGICSSRVGWSQGAQPGGAYTCLHGLPLLGISAGRGCRAVPVTHDHH